MPATTSKSIEIKITADTADAQKNLSSLENSLSNLKKFSANVGNIKFQLSKSSISNLQKLSQINVSGLNRISSSLRNLSTVGKMPTIPATFAQNLSSLALAVQGIDQNSVDAISRIGDALRNMNGIKTPKISDTFADGIRNVADAARSLTDDDISRITDLSNALQNMSGVNLGGMASAARTATRSSVPTDAIEASMFDPGMMVANIEAATSTGSVYFDGLLASASSAFEGIQSVASNAGAVISWVFSDQISAVSGLASTIQSVLHPAIQAIVTAFRAAGVVIGNILKGIGIVAKTTFKAIGAVALPALKAIGTVGKTAVGIAVNKFNELKKSADKLMLSIGRIALYRSIRRVIQLITQAFQEGVKNIYAYSNAMGGQLAANLDSLSSNLMQMKNAIGSAVAPLINALTPAINTVINAVTVLCDRLAQLFSLLGGSSTYTKAIKTQYSFGEAIGETGSAAGGAKSKMDKFTAGIDELNVIDDSSSSGGGGASSYDPTTAFEEATASFGQNLVDMIKNGQWNEAGTMIAEQINGWFDSIDFAELGQTIGTKIQHALEFAAGFLHNLDTFSMGQDLAIALNNALNAIDFELAGDVWVQKFNKVIEFISGFAQEADWSLIGTKIGEFINGALENFNFAELAKGASALASGIFTALAKAIEEIKWEEVGPKIAECLKNIDYGSIVSSFFEFFGAAFGAAAQLWEGIITTIKEEYQKKFIEIFAPYANESGELTIEGFFQGVIDTLADIGQWIVDNIFTPFIEGFKSAFGIASPSKEMETMGGYVIDGLWEGIKNSWHNITEFFDTKLSEIKTKIKTRWEEVKTETTAKWEAIKTKISEKFAEIKEKVITYTSDIKKEISEKWQKIKTETIEKWEEIKNKIKDRFEDIRSNVVAVTTIVYSTVSKKWNELKEATVEKWNAIKEEISAAWLKIYGYTFEKVLSIFNTIKDKWQSIKDETKTTWENVKKFFTDAWDGMVTGIKAPINSILGFVEKFANGVISAVNTVINALNSFASIDIDVPDWAEEYLNARDFSIGFHINTIDPINIPTLESGGFTDADLFYANENGVPEMVGRVGNKTAVANNGQIVDGIASGVTLANGGVESLLEQLIQVVEGKNFNVTVGAKEIGQANEEYQRTRGLYVNNGVFANAY